MNSVNRKLCENMWIFRYAGDVCAFILKMIQCKNETNTIPICGYGVNVRRNLELSVSGIGKRKITVNNWNTVVFWLAVNRLFLHNFRFNSIFLFQFLIPINWLMGKLFRFQSLIQWRCCWWFKRVLFWTSAATNWINFWLVFDANAWMNSKQL